MQSTYEKPIRNIDTNPNDGAAQRERAARGNARAAEIRMIADSELPGVCSPNELAVSAAAGHIGARWTRLFRKHAL